MKIEVELQDIYGTDRQIAEAAWTSSLDYQKKKNRSDEDVKRIINMLADLKHSVPFESIILRFWIKMPIQTDRQFMTHRLQSSSGMSGRYRTMPSEWLDIPEDVNSILDKIPDSQVSTSYNNYCKEINGYYKNLLTDLKTKEKDLTITNEEYKRLREFFRGLLPQNNMTERVSVMNLRSFSNFIKLRLSPHAQPEIREVARQMLEAVKLSNKCPIAIEALERNNWVI